MDECIIPTQKYNNSVCNFNTYHAFVSGSDNTGNGGNAQSAITLGKPMS